MPRPLRFSQPWQCVELTARVIQGRHLLKPSPRANALIAGVLARARERYNTRIFNVVILSNHFHLLAAAASAFELSAFMCFVMTNIAREMGRLHNWTGPFWERRHRSIPITDAEALIIRMRYVFENGCKEGLVKHPALWAGVNAADALTKGVPIEGIWVDRTAMYKARRSKKENVREEDYTSSCSLQLDVLPLWDGLSAARQQENAAELVAEAAKAAPAGAGETTGKGVLTRRPHYRPPRLKQSPAPLCHAGNAEERSAFREAYQAFVAAYRSAAAKLRSRLPALGFPAYAQVMGFTVLEAA